jgi:iron complex outermembrane receptor protein
MVRLPVAVRSAALIGALLLPSLPAAAQTSAPVLAGTVTDNHGRPVGGATVSLQGPETRSVTTPPAGTFRFPDLAAGTYTIRVEALGYTSEPREVEVRGDTAPVELRLDTAPLALAPLQVITTVRSSRSVASLPIKVEVLDEREIQRQQSLATNPTELLANLVPSFSPGRQKLTSAGESFRGRRPLFLIDGVPQSNPLRDGRRDGFTLGMDLVERVEVIFGANAIQGLGATGGIINYITLSPPVSGALEQRVSLSTTADDGLDGDGVGWRAHYQVAKRIDDVDILAAFTYEERGLQFDGEGRPIAIDNVQGDVADSQSRSLFAKVGWEPDGDQRIQLTVNDFRLAQNGEFVSVAGDRSTGMPAVSEPGSPRGTQPVNDVTSVFLDYEHQAVAGGTLSAKAYLQDFSALYGGGVFGIFQDPAIAPVGELFDQSENNSEKLGTRLTWSGAPGDGPVEVVTGFDILRDETFQRLVQSDRNWVPVTRFLNYAPFVQADVQPAPGLTLSAGLRWEIAELDVPDFRTIAGNRDDFTPVEVTGGSPGFDEPLLNVGATLSPLEGVRVYGTFSQAFTMPDVGRVLRGVSQPGTSVEDFLDLQPVETDNLEVGGTWSSEEARVGITWFRSESELGSRLVPNADGIFQVRREPTRTQGWELTGRIDPTPDLSFTAAYSILEGEFDGDDDGDLDSDLGAADIGPDRLNLGLDVNPGGRLTGRVQAFHYFDRDFLDADGVTTASFDGYTTADVSVSGGVGPTTVTLAVSNLLDEQYITYFGQAGTGRDDRYFAGRGRALTLRVDAGF